MEKKDKAIVKKVARLSSKVVCILLMNVTFQTVVLTSTTNLLQNVANSRLENLSKMDNSMNRKISGFESKLVSYLAL